MKKMNSLKKGQGVPLLNFEGSPGVSLLNFRWSWVPLLNFEGVPVSRSRFPGFRGPGVLVPLLHHAIYLDIFFKKMFFTFNFCQVVGTPWSLLKSQKVIL